MRRLLVLATGMAMVMAMTAGTALGRGVEPDKLERAGWSCFPAQGVVHCVPDGDAVFSGDANTSIVLAFAPTGNQTDFLGTELLIHQDLYNGQPCPQDEVTGGDGSYIDLSGMGLPYFVCHHFDSPAT